MGIQSWVAVRRRAGRVALSAAAAAAAAAAALCLVPNPSPGYSAIGGSLGLGQRDLRVHDAFLPQTAADESTAHPSFPGYRGAPLAIWKAAVEWGSELHGDGQGDPHQPGGLGSGGANFDPSWQGLATSIGGQDSNIVSEISGANGGVLAYCETPISNGWRIRFYSNWTWDDGPGAAVIGYDVQGVATHEYGHALGLGHSGWPNATMYASVSGSGVPQRSIEADDRDGIQAVYGSAAANKPRLGGVSVIAGVATLTGSNFASSNNEVWFTQLAAGGTGQPIAVTGVASTGGGTRIVVTVPAAAGAGDVLVKRPGATHADLSNAWPIDPDQDTPGAGPPVLSGLAPDPVPALSAEPVTVTATGSDLTGLISVTVDGSALPAPLFSVADDGLATFEMPLCSKLGPVDVIFENTAGVGATTQLGIAVPSSPALRLFDPVLLSSNGVDIGVGAEPGHLIWVVVSPELLSTPIPGLVEFDIGNQFTSLFPIWGAAIPAEGWVRRVYPVANLAFGTQLHFQAAVYDPVSASLPMTVTNVATGTFYF